MNLAGSMSGNEADFVANQSAVRAGTPGYKSQRENAALSAQQPAEMYASVNRAMQLVVQIQNTEDAISRVQKANGILPTARTPWSILFPSAKKLTPAQLTTLLEPAATAAAMVERDRLYKQEMACYAAASRGADTCNRPGVGPTEMVNCANKVRREEDECINQVTAARTKVK
jgi:hypothetical protein